MRKRKLVVQNEDGVHARVALKIVEKTKHMGAKVTICKGCERADGCSILELLMLGAGKGSEIVLEVVGKDEDETLKEIAEIFTEGAGI